MTGWAFNDRNWLALRFRGGEARQINRGAQDGASARERSLADSLAQCAARSAREEAARQAERRERPHCVPGALELAAAQRRIATADRT